MFLIQNTHFLFYLLFYVLVSLQEQGQADSDAP